MEGVDLIVIIGLGRSVLTNYDAQFKVDCLKVSVVKLAYLAKLLGAKPLDVIFSYEAASN